MGLYLRANKVIFLKRQLSFFLTVLLFNNLFSQNLKLDSFTKDINENELKNLLYVYASDFFKGRETGKLGQKLRDVEEELGSADIKYVLNSVISAVEVDNLDEDDLEDILDRFEDEETGYGDEEPIDDIDMGEEDIDIDLEGGDEDLEDVEDVEVGDEELAVESLKNRIGNILESYIEKKEETTPQKYLKNRLNIVQNKKNIKTQYETVEQEMGTEKILKENKDLKFAGKTKHDNIILKSANREILVNKNGSVI